MQKDDRHPIVERGVALHKMIRLLTAATNGGGYLNFMGNEFGHPEWIDFPREGNDWSYQHARRQWSLADNNLLQYEWLGSFDQAMIETIKRISQPDSHYVEINNHSRSISFVRDGYVFLFNFSPDISLTGHQVLVPAGSYDVEFSSDDIEFGGQGRIDHSTKFLTKNQGDRTFIQVYLPARTATVLRKID